MKRPIAKVIRSGRNQPVRLPKAFQFDCDEVFISRQGDRVILEPRKAMPSSWDEYFGRAIRLTDDFPEIKDLPPKPAPKL
jgi:antitoxin VapB